MKHVFNKLVRDKIPEIIERNGETSITRVLGDDEYRSELYKKLFEEANEVVNAKNKEDVAEELADILEVLISIAELERMNLDDIKEIASQKRLKRGGFKDRIFLEETHDKFE